MELYIDYRGNLSAMPKKRKYREDCILWACIGEDWYFGDCSADEWVILEAISKNGSDLSDSAIAENMSDCCGAFSE